MERDNLTPLIAGIFLSKLFGVKIIWCFVARYLVVMNFCKLSKYSVFIANQKTTSFVIWEVHLETDTRNSAAGSRLLRFWSQWASSYNNQISLHLNLSHQYLKVKKITISTSSQRAVFLYNSFTRELEHCIL